MVSEGLQVREGKAGLAQGSERVFGNAVDVGKFANDGASPLCPGSNSQKVLNCLDIGCGLGGVSDSFAMEGFDVLGIDIEDMPAKGYKHKFIQADIRMLKVSDLPVDFQKPSVIWESLPCRDFCSLGRVFGHRWKRKCNPAEGLKLIQAGLAFIEQAKPRFWVMENVPQLAEFLNLKPRIVKALIGETMRRSFWGNFPLFIMPIDAQKKKLTSRNSSGRGPSHLRYCGKIPAHEQQERAKIPLACGRAFARVCKEALLCKP